MSSELRAAVAAVRDWPSVDIITSVRPAGAGNIWSARCSWCGFESLSIWGPVDPVLPHTHASAGGLLVYVVGGIEVPLG